MKLFSKLAMLGALVASSQAYGALVCVENNSTQCNNYAAQFVISTPTASTVRIQYNAGSYTGAMDIIYIDPVNTLAAGFTLSQTASTGTVNFSGTGSPANLPGGNNAAPPFVAYTNLASTSNANRVSPGESITFALSGNNLGDMFNNGLVRIGVHLQSIGGPGVSGSDPSDTFYFTTITTNNIPEPQSAALLGTGLIGLAFAAKRMRRK